MDKKQYQRLKFFFFDLLAAFIVWVLFTYFRQIINDGRLFENVQIYIPKYNLISSIMLYPLFSVFIHWLSGFYTNPLDHTKIRTLLTTLSSSIIIAIVIFFFLLLDDVVISYQYYYYSLLVLLGLQFGITLFFRIILIVRVNHRFNTKRWTINTIIIGSGDKALTIASEFQKKAGRHSIVGFISENRKQKSNEKMTFIGTLQEMGQLIENHKIQEIIVALDDDNEDQLFPIVNKLFQYNVTVRFTPRLNEILTGSAQVYEPGISPLVNITSLSMSDWQACVKRFFDISVSLFALIVLLPLILILAIWIKLDSKGGVFYKQERIGRHGRSFNIMKFRTMCTNAESGAPQLSSARDKRVTRVGNFLRKYRLDELPQFWNVLIGEMSLVGPRPERMFYIKQIMEKAPYYCLIYKIRPGLTSWGPIRIGYSDTIDKMVERLNYDIIYLENMSLMVDLKILFFTIEVIFKGKGV